VRTPDRITGQQRRLRMGFLEIFHDRQRLGQDGPIVENERRNQLLRVESGVVRRKLLALAQVPRRVLDRNALEVQGNAHAKRRRGSEIADELHDRLRGHCSTAQPGGV